MPVLALLALSATAGGIAVLLSLRYPSPMVEQEATEAVTDALVTQATGDTARGRLLRNRLDPTTATGLALTVALVGVALGGVLVGLLAYLTRSSEALADVDMSVGQWGADHRSDGSTSALRWLTNLGDTWACLGLALLIGAIEVRRVPSRWIPAFLGAVILGNVILVNAVKALLDRVRPTFDPFADTLGPSFPSGHTAMAAAFWAAVALLLARRRSPRTRALLSGAAVALAVTVAGTRVLLGVHWLTDVIAGLAFGWAWFAVCSIAFGGRLISFGAPVAAAQEVARPQTS
ncbi:MAG: phosphatase PAP2 family protein [Gaiella sp.]